MAVTRTIAERNTQANQENDSPVTAVVTSNLKTVMIQLSSSQWSNAALAGNKVLWGVQLSRDGGLTWGPGLCDSTSTNTIGGGSLAVPAWAYQTDTIGNFSKNGGLPYFQFSLDDLTIAQGATTRLFAWPTVAIPLGAVVTIN